MVDLKEFRIFSDLKDKELDKLRESIRTINYGRGEIIFQEGAPAFGFYLIFEGMVKLVKRSMRAKSQILKIAGPGEILGETTLFDKGSHNAYAKTIDVVTVGFIERGDFFYFLERHPKTIFRLYEKLSEELRGNHGVAVEPLTLDLCELDFLGPLVRTCEGKDIGLVVSFLSLLPRRLAVVVAGRGMRAALEKARGSR